MVQQKKLSYNVFKFDHATGKTNPELLIIEAKPGFPERYMMLVFGLNVGTTINPLLLQSTHVATAPPPAAAPAMHSLLASAHEQPTGHKMHVSRDELLPPVQTKGLSTAHAPLQPSPLTVPPSSHCSAPIRTPSPHTAEAQNLALDFTTRYVVPG